MVQIFIPGEGNKKGLTQRKAEARLRQGHDVFFLDRRTKDWTFVKIEDLSEVPNGCPLFG